MKSTLIVVCGLIAAIAGQPAFATDAPKPPTEKKPASRPVHRPVRAAKGNKSGNGAVRVAHAPAKSKPIAKATSKPKPRAVAAKPVVTRKPPPPQYPWIGRTVTISPSERDVIRAYVRNRMDASKGGKFNGVSQGLSKKVTWGWGKLPDGWENKCVRGQVLPGEIHKRCHSLPDDVIVHLPPPPPGTVLLAVGGKVIRVGYPTYEILDTFDVHSPPAELMGLRPSRPALRLAAATAIPGRR